MEEIQSIDKDVDTHSIQLGKTPPTLTYFCVYNSSLSQSEENTKDQILYYTAKKVVPADVKMKQVGLAQALVNFTSAFSPSQLAQNVHTQKNRMVFLQPEEGFWIHMSIELGILRRHIKDSKGKEKLVTEYLDASLNDRALEAVLKVGYEQFRLLNGTFASLLYGEETSSPSKMPSRQHMRSLMHSIEEFFSDWIWKLDFDRLDTMVFSAVFNGVPSYPILRSTYMRVHELDQSIVDKFHSAIDHLVVLDADEGSLVYRSPSISINDVCALRKYILKRVEKGLAQDQEREKRLQERKLAASKSDTKMSGFKLLTKSFSHAQIFNYFSSSASKSNLPIHSAPISEANSTESIPSLPATSHIPPQPSSPTTAIPTTDMRMTQGKYLTGLVEDYCMDMDGEERCIARAEIVRVYLSSRSALENASTTPEPHDGLTEYFLVIYKHQSNLVWSFLLPSFSAEAQEMIVDASFYPSLENHLIDQHIEPLTATVLENMQTAQEKR
ncbi:uncharacterized protein BYT42DRAFT_502387 [Radiomyces spectabilis]|uniref:uncharacterized protein n=1 Tax=Radiomyces spectabilis TaxID=64574 RepID=UPI0022208517|nr:uncharacterized protein BYT42DRAFT_502387 [Radiomyces spectabilis]KAI8370599.1 hypothetical protein BYT42DRAFT_502387 [Radiomyces spectabilis]